MPAKRPRTNADSDLSLANLSAMFVDEDKAREWLEAKRWPNGPVCPHCQCDKVYRLEPKAESKSPVRKGVLKCSACRKQFTVRVGTIFEESKLPISKWLMAIHLMCSSKKGVSSHQLARELDITVKSAWFVSHRIREAMNMEPMAGMLKGEVEADETYVGGKPRYKGNNPRGRGTAKKPVMVLVERDGRAHAHPIDSVDAATLKGSIRALVDPSATVMTDELTSYAGIGEEFAGGHHTVNHSKKEYVRREPVGDVFVSTNSAESFFALLKRGHYGIFHQMSRKHLHRYCEEYSFRWSQRKVSDGERMVAAVKGAEGKRLRYRKPVE